MKKAENKRKALNLVYRKLDELKPYANNPRKITNTAIEVVSNSIASFGIKQPIVIDHKNYIVCGHTRLKALEKLRDNNCKKIDFNKIPCIVADDLSKSEIKAYRLADNKTSEFSKWNDLLDTELKELEDMHMEDFGFTPIEDLSEIEEDEIEEPLDIKVKEGDVWILGNHRLMCGDSTKIDDVQRLMGGGTVDLLITDPPYNVAFNGRSGNFEVIKNDNLTKEQFEEFIEKTIAVIKELKIKNYYIWCNWKFYSSLQVCLDFKACIVWAKNNIGMGKGYRHQHEFCLFNGEIDKNITNETDLWEIKKDTKYMHPTQKPVELFARAINNHSKAKNVLDLFGGSGTSIMACEELNRKCYTMELDPKYCQVIIDRWEKLTGKKAKLEGK